MSAEEKEELRREYLEIHNKLGNTSLPYDIRCKLEKIKDEATKKYFTKFGKHISSEL